MMNSRVINDFIRRVSVYKLKPIQRVNKESMIARNIPIFLHLASLLDIWLVLYVVE